VRIPASSKLCRLSDGAVVQYGFTQSNTEPEGHALGPDTSNSRLPDDGGPAVGPLRAVVAEDEVLLREGLASLLDRSGFEVVGQAGDATELLALVRDRSPDVVVVDIRMPPTHTTEGLDAARVIREEMPNTGIMVPSAHVDVEHAMELLASGHGIGYLLKSRVTDVAEFVDNLRRIAKGASVVDPGLVQELVSARRRDDPLAVLSSRELEVLALMAEGRSIPMIGPIRKRSVAAPAGASITHPPVLLGAIPFLGNAFRRPTLTA
jgi:DNA-binding NarL/FixJ family response regulator